MEHYFTNNSNLKSEIKNITYQYQNYRLEFFSDNGVFSKNKIDYGSKLLLETILKEDITFHNFLDVGCGYGFLGISIGKIKNVTGDLIDINKRALHLTKRNILKNKVNLQSFYSNVYDSVTNTYDVIITNPPIRAGKDVVLNILLNAKQHLNKDGLLYFVIHKDQGAKSIYETMKKHYTCQILEKNKGFWIFKAKNIDNQANN